MLVPTVRRMIKDKENTVIMPTDLGGAKRANHYAQALRTDIAFTYKVRNYCKANTVDKISILGDVKGKDVYIVDDMICTGGTLVKALEETKNMGAKKVIAVCTHALFNGPAWERFQEAYEKGFLDMVIGTDSTYHSKEFLKKSPWFKEVSIANYFADTISRINQRKSITDLLD